MAGLKYKFLLLAVLLMNSSHLSLTQEEEDYEEYEDEYEDEYDEYDDYADYEDEYDDYGEDYEETVTRAPTTTTTAASATTTTKKPWWLTSSPPRRRTLRPTPRRTEFITPGPTVRKSVVTQRPDPRRDPRRDPNRSVDNTRTVNRGRYDPRRYPATTRSSRNVYSATGDPLQSRYETVTRATPRSRLETVTRATPRSRYPAPTRATSRSRYDTTTKATQRSRYGAATGVTPRSRYDTATRATPRSRYDTATRATPRTRYETATSGSSRRESDTNDGSSRAIYPTRAPSRTRYVGTTVDPRRAVATQRSGSSYSGSSRLTEVSRRYNTNRRTDVDDEDVDQDSGDANDVDCGCQAVQELREENVKLKSRLERIERRLGDVGETVVRLELDSENWKRSLRFPGLTAIKNPSNIVLTEDVVSDQKYRDCQDVMEKGNSRPGVYGIQPENSAYGTYAYCQDGWTFLQRRFDGSVPFDRKYDEYVKGFGNFSSEFWLGLENIHQLTSQDSYTLRVDMETSNTKFHYAMYSDFRVSNESERYSLEYGNFTTGNFGDGLHTARGRPFSTRDRDRDNWSYGNCAQFFHSGFWLNKCGTDLNRIPELGRYGGMRWDRQVVVSSLMRVKPTRDVQPNEYKLVP